MALYLPGPTVAQVSGRIGGMVYANNLGGLYIRNGTVPLDPKSPAQVARRSTLSSLAVNWGRILTDAQRGEWTDYADNVTISNRLGQAIKLPPISWYVAANTSRIIAGLSRVDDGPAIFDMAATDPTITFGADETVPEAAISFDSGLDWVGEDGAALAVFVSRPQNATIEFFNGPYLFGSAVLGDSVAPPAPPQAITYPFSLATGQKVFAYARILRADGRYSPKMQLSAIAT